MKANPAKPPSSGKTALMQQAFRPFFLGGAFFAAFAIALWGLSLNGLVSFSPYSGLMFWHQHEMLFGFVAAIVVGFLLTAVQNWTGIRATHGIPLAALFACWLLARVLMLFGGNLPPVWVATIDLLFLPAAALLMARIVITANNRRNLVFVPVLLLLSVTNLTMHLGALYQLPEWISYASMATVLLITLLMSIVTGRVIPMFTANGTDTQRQPPLKWLDAIALGTLWLLALLFLLQLAPRMPSAWLSAIFTLGALSGLVRLLRWRFWLTGKVPLLWSLHAAAGFIPLGLGLFALRYAGFAVTYSGALHALTAGAMGTMILSMIARISLGHTGRALKPHPAMGWAFTLLILSALVRIAAGWLLPGSALGWLSAAAIAWVVAFAIYLVLYLAILVTPRVDGKAG